MKKTGIKMAIISGLIIALIIYMDGVKEDKFKQQKEEIIANITSHTNDEEIYEVYVFGEGGTIPSDFEEQVNELHMKYGHIISNLTTMPYSDTTDTEYAKYFDIKEYPTIIVFDSEGIVNRSYSPNELEKFLSSNR